MAYHANPFLERMSERTSDQEFVRLFSPKILDRLDENAMLGAVHLFTSPPGGGKTTLLRAFTPPALRAFWNARAGQVESYQRLVSRQVLHETEGPQLLGVLLSCASGYADLPPGASMAQSGLFRALFDCRVLLRALRSLSSLLGHSSTDDLTDVRLEYDDLARDLKAVPMMESAVELARWAEERERAVYAKLDTLDSNAATSLPLHVRFESVLWLQSVRFVRLGKVVAPRRLLMIDDFQKLRKKQRSLMLEELVELRPAIPVWLAERSIALGDALLSQGARQGRDLQHYPMDDMWAGKTGQHQFSAFAQSILDRRLDVQSAVPAGHFSQYLEDQLTPDDVADSFTKAIKLFSSDMEGYRANILYADWIARAEQAQASTGLNGLIELYVTRILIARSEAKRQLTLGLAPLPTDEIEDTDAKVMKAAEIFCHEDLRLPYFYGVDRLCSLATTNVEELLALAAGLYEGILAKQVLRRQSDLRLTPADQERRIKDVAKRKRDFIPKSHTEGTRAQRLLDAIGAYCRDKTFQSTASYAPGVTGIRLSGYCLARLLPEQTKSSEPNALLARVLWECVAENLLTTRDSAASTSRDEGTVFYLNRSLCAYYDLPIQYGGWQDVSVETLITWVDLPSANTKRRASEATR